MNACTLTGNIGREPELLQNPGKPTLLRFSMAEKRERAKDGEEAVWWTVNVWHGMARALAEHLHAGMAVTVTGRASAKTWVNKGGETKLERVLDADAVGWLDKREDRQPAQRAPMQHETAQAVDDDDDPFGDQ
jgi:single-strand DNA-binding protein